jgi:hypothetical protein
MAMCRSGRAEELGTGKSSQFVPVLCGEYIEDEAVAKESFRSVGVGDKMPVSMKECSLSTVSS